MRNLFHHLVLGSCIGLIAGLPITQAAAADLVSDQEKEDIAQLLKINMTDPMADDWADEMAKSLSDTPIAAVPQEDMDTLKAQAKIVLLAQFAKTGGLSDQVTDFYERNFTGDEIRQLLAFYQSPLGKKMMSLQPEDAKLVTAIMQQDMPVIIKTYRQRIAQCKRVNQGEPLKCPD